MENGEAGQQIHQAPLPHGCEPWHVQAIFQCFAHILVSVPEEESESLGNGLVELVQRGFCSLNDQVLECLTGMLIRGGHVRGYKRPEFFQRVIERGGVAMLGPMRRIRGHSHRLTGITGPTLALHRESTICKLGFSGLGYVQPDRSIMLLEAHFFDAGRDENGQVHFQGLFAGRVCIVGGVERLSWN